MIVWADEGRAVQAGPSSLFVAEPALRRIASSPVPDETRSDVRRYQNFAANRQQWLALTVTGMFIPPPVVQNEYEPGFGMVVPGLA